MKIKRFVPGGSITASPVFLMVVALIALPAFGSPIFLIPVPANSFGFLGYTVSNTGTSVIAGNVGAMSTVTMLGGTATGFACTPTSAAPCTSGDDSLVTAAYDAIFNTGGAFSVAEGLSPSGSFTTDTSQTFLGNTVYGSGTISTTTGTNLIFDAKGDPTAVFVIKIDGALTVNGAMTFTLQGEAQADNIYWIVEDAATISVGSSGPIVFDGNILAGSTFTMSAASGGSGVLAGTINGCVFSQTTDTLAGQTNVNGCSSSGSSSSTPEPGSSLLVALGCLVCGSGLRRCRKSKA